MIHSLAHGDFSRRPPTNWGEASWGQRLLAVSMAAAPRGWYFQNMASTAEMPDVRTAVDAAAKRVNSAKAEQVLAGSTVWASGTSLSPYSVLAKWGHPNFFKSLTTTARIQTWVNLAQVACTLERHRAAKGAYPETLAALASEFTGKLPHDLFGSQPLRYRGTADGKFLLYSIGYNSKDDSGGVPGEKADRTHWREDQGDWVWEGLSAAK